MNYIKKIYLIMMIALMSVSAYANNNLVVSTPQYKFTEKQITRFAEIASNLTMIKAAILQGKQASIQSFDKRKDVTPEQITCLGNQFSEDGFLSFMTERTKRYLADYPQRYEHDLALMQSDGARWWKNTIATVAFKLVNKDNHQTQSFEDRLAELPMKNLIEYSSLTGDPINKPLQDFLLIVNNANQDNGANQGRELVLLYITEKMLSCDIKKL